MSHLSLNPGTWELSMIFPFQITESMDKPSRYPRLIMLKLPPVALCNSQGIVQFKKLVFADSFCPLCHSCDLSKGNQVISLSSPR